MNEVLEPLNEIEVRAKVVVSALEVVAYQIVVSDKASADECGQFLKHCAARKKAIEEEFKPICDAAFRAHREAVAFRDKVLATVEPASALARDKLATWQRAEEARLREEARIKQEAENERRRIEYERQMKEAEEQRQREEAERWAALAAAKAAKDKAAMEAIKAAPPPVVAYVAPPEPAYVAPAPPPKVAGFSRPKTWKAEVINMAELPREYMLPNQQALDSLAKSTKGAVKVPGVRFYEVETTSVRA